MADTWVDLLTQADFAAPTVAANAAAGSAGSAATALRSDAKLQVAVASPATFTASAADGTSDSLARADHQHAWGTIGIDLPMNSHKITGLADPSSAQDAATKAYVDSLSQGLDVKPSVRAATTVAGTLASSFENGDTIDGVVLATSDRILIKNQAAPAENGIYIVQASGAPTRASDMDAWTEVPGAFVFVEEGTANADTGWVSTGNAGGTINSTSMPWVQFSTAGTITADEVTLTMTGTVLSIKNLGVGTGQIAADAVTFAKIQNASGASKVLGRGSAGGGGDFEELTLGASLIPNGTVIERAALTGDVTAAQNSNSTTIAAGAVTFAKMAAIATDRLIGRDTAGSGDPEAISVGGGVEFSGSLSIQRSALTGDVTAPAGSNSTTIAANAVTDAKFRAGAARSVVGVTGNAGANVADIAAAAVRGESLRYNGSALSFGPQLLAPYAQGSEPASGTNVPVSSMVFNTNTLRPRVLVSV